MNSLPANVLLMRKRPASSFVGGCGFTSEEEDRSSSPVSAMLDDGPARKRTCFEAPLLVVSPPGSPSTSSGTTLASSDSDDVSTTRASPLPLLSTCAMPSGGHSKVVIPQSDDSDVEDEAQVDDAEISLSASILLSMASDHSGTDSASHTPKKTTAPSPSRALVVDVTNTASSPSGVMMVRVPAAPGPSTVVASPTLALSSSSSSASVAASSMKRVLVSSSTVPFVVARRHSSSEESMNHLSKKKRQRTSAEQLAVLERIFETDKMPNQQTRMRLAEQLCMSSRRVQIWFQNKRAKVKRMSLKDSDDVMPDNSSTGQREVSAASSDECSYSEEEVDEAPLTAADALSVPKKSTSVLPIPTSLNNVVLPGGSCTKFDHPAYYQFGVNKENMSIHSYNASPFVKMGFPLSA